ncbi:hypothetical protein [Actinoplanes subtropicus]|uniref:hypothetical protein n=1 Tax=Actinoplanes subtropicus TaxID=543632 RepID=UPI0004C4182D|nr:hypothetical protein [Actinoplanes subtropicus]
MLTSLVGETRESAKFRTRGQIREKVTKGDEVLLRGLDGTLVGYASVTAVLPIGLIIALALDGLAGADVPLSAEVWLPEGDHDPGPPTPAHTMNQPGTSLASVVATCVVCGAKQPARPFAEPLQCPRCLAYLVVGYEQTQELGPNQLMPRPTLLIPLPALPGQIEWPQMCACCGGPAEKTAEVSTTGSIHQAMTGGALDFMFREIPAVRTLSPSWYETYRSVGTSGSGGPAPGWAFPLCGVDNPEHQDPVTVWTQDGALGFRSYRYHREFCRGNRLSDGR